jgi:hypothetical protein
MKSNGVDFADQNLITSTPCLGEKLPSKNDLNPNQQISKSVDMSEMCQCGMESDINCHFIQNSEVCDEYYCETCYFKQKRNKYK